METAKKMIEEFNKIKTIPHNVTRLAQLINDENSTLTDFEKTIRIDPILVARLLTLVNSSYFGLTRKVDSISRAVALLGMKNLHNIAVTDALKGIFKDSSPKQSSFSINNVWAHSASAGICCKMLAERIFSLNGDDAYLCGLLHDIGLIVEHQVSTQKFLTVFEKWSSDNPVITEIEQEAFATDHCQIGYLLAQQWQFSEPLALTIRNHHSTYEDTTPESPEGILQLSLYIISQLGFTLKEDSKENAAKNLSAPLSKHLQENLEEYKIIIEDLPEEIENARQMYQG